MTKTEERGIGDGLGERAAVGVRVAGGAVGELRSSGVGEAILPEMGEISDGITGVGRSGVAKQAVRKAGKNSSRHSAGR